MLLKCIPNSILGGIDTYDNYQNEEYVGKGLAQGDLSKVTVISKFHGRKGLTNWRNVLKKEQNK